jgi:hypothetical protein
MEKMRQGNYAAAMATVVSEAAASTCKRSSILDAPYNLGAAVLLAS